MRDVVVGHLDAFFAQQREPEGCSMAAFPSRERNAFFAHWNKILSKQTVTIRTIPTDGQIAGNVLCWEQEDRRFIGYWFGKVYWHRGVATRALAAFLKVVAARPVFACVAAHNVASVRVLEKCGFAPCGAATVQVEESGDVVEEWLFRLV